MREIKFRAWDKISNQMSEPFGLGVHPYLDTQWPSFPGMDMDLEIMQYTGLKDRNGKEIYEGDIVKYIDDSRTPQIGKVVYRMVSYYFEAIGGDEEGNQDIQPYKPEEKEYEVIGNIYENPELEE